MKTAIWTEGIADQKFLADAMEEWFGLKFKSEPTPSFKNEERERLKFVSQYETGSVEIFDLEGKDDFLNVEKVEFFKQVFNLFEANLLFLDSDKDWQARQKEVDKINALFEIKFNYSLFPNLNENGDLETLLCKIINPANTTIFECWAAYEDCLRSKENPKRTDKKFTTPASKTKIYAYLEALLGESKKQKKLIKEAERNYRNENHWNLNSDDLNPLKEFLQKNLILP